MDTDNVWVHISDYFHEMMPILNEESERGCALISVAWIEEELTTILKNHFLPSKDIKNDELFGKDRPLENFGAKINCAYRLGLINYRTKKTLDYCRKIRNLFAHKSNKITYTDDSIKDMILNIFELNNDLLNLIYRIVAEHTSDIAIIESNINSKNTIDFLDKTMGRKGLFIATLAIIASALKSASFTTQRVKEL